MYYYYLSRVSVTTFDEPGHILGLRASLHLAPPPQPGQVRGAHHRVRALIASGLCALHSGLVHLRLAIAAVVRLVSLRTHRGAVLQVYHLQHTPPQLPLVPVVVGVDVPFHEMCGRLCACLLGGSVRGTTLVELGLLDEARNGCRGEVVLQPQKVDELGIAHRL